MLRELAQQKILVFEGAMGTQIQARNLGPPWEACAEWLHQKMRAMLIRGLDIQLQPRFVLVYKKN